jgi:hypothetical protein
VLKALVEAFHGGDYLPLEVDDMFHLKEQAGGLHMTTCSGSLGFSGVGDLDMSHCWRASISVSKGMMEKKKWQRP